MIDFLTSKIGYSIITSINVILLIGILGYMILFTYNVFQNSLNINERVIWKYTVAVIIFFTVIACIAAFQYNLSEKMDKKNTVKTNKEDSAVTDDKFDFIEREFNRQVKHQLKDMNIIIFLDDFYSGEYEDRFIEMKGDEYGLYLKNTLFYDKKVIYEFIHKTSKGE